jgi:hypothetical protein
MPGGGRLTVTTLADTHPAPVVYEMTVKPVFTPVTMPVNDPTAAMMGLLDIQVPPGDASVSVIEEPIHTTDGPDTGTGGVFTVTVANAVQPAPVV